jgi:Ca-activated chloride channel family protein
MESEASPGAHRPARARAADRDPAPRNLVFLLDVSGSMMPADKLPLVRNGDADADRRAHRARSRRHRRLRRASGLVCRRPLAIRRSASWKRSSSWSRRLDQRCEGIQLAYQVARRNFIRGGVNRVVLATDGDFNVGVTNESDLVRLIERERESGIFLSVLGVGTGNLKDSTMEKLADKGNGNYSYLDSCMRRGRCSCGGGWDARNHREGREDPGRVQPSRSAPRIA